MELIKVNERTAINPKNVILIMTQQITGKSVIFMMGSPAVESDKSFDELYKLLNEANLDA